MKIFLIGPGGAGKSTVGKILANNLGVPCIDLDTHFMSSISHIGEYIANNGYGAYKKRNSELAYQLVQQAPESYVFVTSSGFLAHEEYRDKNKKLLSEGVQVMLMPSRCIDECEEIIVMRQLARGFGLNEDSERIKIRERFEIYRTLGEIKIFSQALPNAIAQQIISAINSSSKK